MTLIFWAHTGSVHGSKWTTELKNGKHFKRSTWQQDRGQRARLKVTVELLENRGIRFPCRHFLETATKSGESKLKRKAGMGACKVGCWRSYSFPTPTSYCPFVVKVTTVLWTFPLNPVGLQRFRGRILPFSSSSFHKLSISLSLHQSYCLSVHPSGLQRVWCVAQSSASALMTPTTGCQHCFCLLSPGSLPVWLNWKGSGAFWIFSIATRVRTVFALWAASSHWLAAQSPLTSLSGCSEHTMATLGEPGQIQDFWCVRLIEMKINGFCVSNVYLGLRNSQIQP